jgi:RNA polymerase sigma-70 factor, ECF subfamily
MPNAELPIDQAARTDDVALVHNILDGDDQAFERLMRRHNRRLFRVARSIVHDDDEAEDVLQEGYIRAYQSLAGFRGEARLSTWLTRIVVNQALQRRRRRETIVRSEPADEATSDEVAAVETPESLAMRAELRRLIEASVDELPTAYRSVFVLRAVEGLSVSETATSLGISEASAKTRFLRARRQLRRAVGLRIGPLLEGLFPFAGRRCDHVVKRVCARLGLTIVHLPACGEFSLLQ